MLVNLDVITAVTREATRPPQVLWHATFPANDDQLARTRRLKPYAIATMRLVCSLRYVCPHNGLA